MNRMGSLEISELSTSPVTINRSEPVSKAIGLLRKTKAYEVFVIDEKEVLGIVTIRDLLKARHILTGKIASLMTRIPVLTRRDSVGRAAKTMTAYRVRAVPIVEGGELVGQVTASSICNLMVQAGRMNLSAGRMMTPNPMVLQEGDFAAKARTVMIQKNIDHLPVFRGRDIVGIVTSDALVFRMTPSERIGADSLVAERQRRLELKVSGLMATDPVTSTPETEVSQVIKEMNRRRTTYSLVAVWGELQGIITYRDCVRLLVTPVTEAVPISIVGLPDDPFEGQVARTKFERVVKRLAKSLPSLLEARSVIRTSEKTGQRRRYEVEVALITPSRTISFRSSGWSLPAIYDELSDRMKRLTTKKLKKKGLRPE
jgi:CBS domain-containing protein